MSEFPTVGVGYTAHCLTYWFRRCDMCKKRAPFGRLHECYPPIGSGFGWWFACCRCVDGISKGLAERVEGDAWPPR